MISTKDQRYFSCETFETRDESIKKEELKKERIYWTEKKTTTCCRLEGFQFSKICRIHN
jgi:hypothetical protein